MIVDVFLAIITVGWLMFPKLVGFWYPLVHIQVILRLILRLAQRKASVMDVPVSHLPSWSARSLPPSPKIPSFRVNVFVATLFTPSPPPPLSFFQLSPDQTSSSCFFNLNHCADPQICICKRTLRSRPPPPSGPASYPTLRSHTPRAAKSRARSPSSRRQVRRRHRRLFEDWL